jgi:hypothetical protein
MKIYPSPHTDVALYIIEQHLEVLLKSVCHEKGLTIYSTHSKSDLLKCRFRLAFIDVNQLDADLMSSLNAIAESSKKVDWQIIFLGGVPEDIPAPLKLYTKTLSRPRRETIKNILENNFPAKPEFKGDVFKPPLFKQKIFRILYLYHLEQTNPVLYKNQLCGTLGITERTLFRDLKILKEMFPDKNFHLQKENV